MLEAVAPALPTLHELRGALAESAGAFNAVAYEVIKAKFGVDWAYNVRNENFFKKLEEVITMTEDYVYKHVTVEREPLEIGWQWPKAIIRFKLGGEEVAYIIMYWTGDKLFTQFRGSREKAERLASVIRALGGKAEVKHVKGAGWVVQLYTDGITAIRHDGWLKAVRSFVDELYGKGLIDKDRYKQLVRDIEAGPNVVKFAGVEFSAYYTNRGIQVNYQPRSKNSKNAALNALKARGLKEGVHFTVKEYGGYEIRVTDEFYAKAVEALAQSELKEREHYAVDGGKRVISVKAKHKDAAVNALKAAGLEEGKHFTVKWNGQYIIHITYEGLREIQRMALKGGAEAERFTRGLEDVLRRRYGDDAVKKLIEVLTPVREEGTLDLPLAVYDERGNLIARVVDLRYEFVKGKQRGKRSAGQPVSHCAGKDCRLRVVVEYEVPSGERRQFKMEWYWKKQQKKKGKTTATYYLESARPTVKDDVEAAVLKALTRGKVEKGQVWLHADQLEALRRFKALKDAVDQWRAGKPQSKSSRDAGQSD
ncbi:PaRep2b protein [Pyrobaculum aerophilum]|uniref:PaRep2b domain-containing protein n=1 Tax=Pyrobaculum aerophilum TaxID=13773 RepID=A0A371R422_9CREN|nr:PaRep2b protein [Pyrobaculum aerophilum]RFA98524.1 hypothetical protein CGL51_00370 [Pyrobaculum aerophilum]RFB00026.1 hypothetical protein CGL52_02365 [Pyrobaculum aerophilum]